jgi:hypothetical protein
VQVKKHYYKDEKAKLTTMEEAFCGIVGGTLATWNQPFEVSRIGKGIPAFFSLSHLLAMRPLLYYCKLSSCLLPSQLTSSKKRADLLEHGGSGSSDNATGADNGDQITGVDGGTPSCFALDQLPRPFCFACG